MRSTFNKSGNLVLALSLTSVLTVAACSPAKWRETKAAPKAPPVVAQQVPQQQPLPQPIPQQPGRPGQPPAGPQEPFDPNKKICGQRYKGPNCFHDTETTPKEEPKKPSKKDPTPSTDTEAEWPADVTKKPAEPQTPAPQSQDDDDDQTPSEIGPDRYFVVQNVATEKLRVYERCHTSGCRNRLVFETDMVVGQDNDQNRTMLGLYEISKWFKFYEDESGKFPSFWNSNFPELPGAGANVKAWFSKNLLPMNRGQVRGAFGWYTAHIQPDSGEQWIHGTWGWGKDGDRFIQALRSGKFDSNSVIASHGCTRVENRAIALMREILVPGTKVLKIYAREAYSRPEKEIRAQKPQKWRWVLTKEDDTSAGLLGFKDRGVSEKMILDKGPAYQLDNRPTVARLKKSHNAHESGNVYGVPVKEMKGYFLVDSGQLLDYRHPAYRKIKVGGMKDDMPAEFVSAK